MQYRRRFECRLPHFGLRVSDRGGEGDERGPAELWRLTWSSEKRLNEDRDGLLTNMRALVLRVAEERTQRAVGRYNAHELLGEAKVGLADDDLVVTKFVHQAGHDRKKDALGVGPAADLLGEAVEEVGEHLQRGE